MSTTQPARFAQAAGPFADATVIRTPAEGLHTQRITYDAADGPVAAYLARPDADSGRLPVVIVVSEAFGLHAHIEDIARRFARLGYLAVAPDLMSRHGDPAAYTDVDTLVTQLLQHIPDAEVLSDLDATVARAVAAGGDPHRIGITGYCWGGRWVWLYAAHAQLDAAIAWYGILDGGASGAYPDDDLFPRHPLDIADTLRTPVLGLYGGKDDAIPLPSIEQMRRRLAARTDQTPDAEVQVYPEAGHAFFADYRDTYAPAAAADAWQRATGWLRQHGV